MKEKELKEQAKQVLKDIQRRIQSSENYGEWHAANQIINFWNDNVDSIDIDEYTHFWIDFYALLSSMKLISSKHQTNHWGQVVCSRIGSFLTIYDLK